MPFPAQARQGAIRGDAASFRGSTRPVGHAAGAAQKLTTTVPKEYVHREALAEVFLTDCEEVGPGMYQVSAQWPRAHSLYSSRVGLHDPLLLLESIRQLTPLLSHTAYGVPLGHRLIWKDLRCSIAPQALRAGAVPADVRLRVRSDAVTGRQGFRGARLDVRAERDGSHLASAATTFTCHTPAVYRRLRGRRCDARAAVEAAIPVPRAATPQSVGRDRTSDVVLSPAGRPDRWQLRVDPSHPVLFDHPVDHAPGMLLLEAARQAAVNVTDPRSAVPVSWDTTFHRYAELDAPCWIESSPSGTDAEGRPRVEVTAHQGGQAVFQADVAVSVGGSGTVPA
jgi:2-oxo-3-(phosphooxy)propyl 3-oxoalkanoate synthase